MNVPLNYWIIMIVSHLIHVYLKVEADVKQNKIAFESYYTDKWKLLGVIIGLIQSSVLLVAGYDAYMKYVSKLNGEPSIYISFVVAFIGYGGSSLWNNIMDIIKSKLTNVSDNS